MFYATDREVNDVGPLTFLNKPDAKERLHYGLCEARIEALSSSDPVAVDKGFVNRLQAYASSNDLFSAIIANHPSSVLIHPWISKLVRSRLFGRGLGGI